MEPEEILDPLDPDQRAVAVARPDRSRCWPVPVRQDPRADTSRGLRRRHWRHGSAADTGRHVHDPGGREFSRRLRAMGVNEVRVRTVHSEALRQLRWMWPHAVGGQMPRIQASKIGLVSAALTRAGIKLDDAGRRDVTSEIERAKAIGLGPQEVGAQGVPGRATRGGLPGI